MHELFSSLLASLSLLTFLGVSTLFFFPFRLFFSGGVRPFETKTRAAAHLPVPTHLHHHHHARPKALLERRSRNSTSRILVQSETGFVGVAVAPPLLVGARVPRCCADFAGPRLRASPLSSIDSQKSLLSFMTDLRQKLEQLGLTQYFEIFVTEGFDTWETVLDIRESDLDSLNVKLGHRRKLQRAIAETRGIPLERIDRPLPHLQAASSVDGSYRSDDSASESKSGTKRSIPPSNNTGNQAKRKYRRHPKPDENAPERPASAYVIFSNQMRETLKGQELTFTEIAKLVGERWQTLSPNSREACERQAATAKEKYYAELAEYKKTPEYTKYQEYLVEFRAKHNLPQSEVKRSKADEAPKAARSTSHELFDKSARRRDSDAYFTHGSLFHRRSGSSPPPGPHSRPGGRQLASKSTSPAGFSHSGIGSPGLAGHYSPMSASPTSATVLKEPEFSHSSTPTQAEVRDRPQEAPYSSIHNYAFPRGTAPPLTSNYAASVSGDRDMAARRIRRESSSLPSLVHDDTTATTLSSESNHPPSNHSNAPLPPPQTSLLPLPDAQKAHRVLPQPIPSTLAMAHSPLDAPRPIPINAPPPPKPSATFPSLPHQSQPHDGRQNSSLAVLLRAGELARDADPSPPGGKEYPP